MVRTDIKALADLFRFTALKALFSSPRIIGFLGFLNGSLQSFTFEEILTFRASGFKGRDILFIPELCNKILFWESPDEILYQLEHCSK